MRLTPSESSIAFSAPENGCHYIFIKSIFDPIGVLKTMEPALSGVYPEIHLQCSLEVASHDRPVAPSVTSHLPKTEPWRLFLIGPRHE